MSGNIFGMMKIKYLLIGVFLSAIGKLWSQEFTYKFQNPKLPVESRIHNLLSLMTQEEKVSQLLYNSPAIERLGIPEYNWWNECLHGVARAGKATVFPQAIGMAATFDDDLVYRVADAISTEARAKYNEAVRKGNRSQYMGLTFWSPNVNIFRDPRWGRGQETYGEDPYLSGRMGAAYVKGLQGDNPQYLKTAACAKHFAVHSGPEKSRHEFNAEPSEKDLRETYLPAFKVLTDAGVESVMCAYNRLDNEPCCGSNRLLNDILRKEWGFRGHIVSDCWALDDIWARHKTVATREEAASMAANAGVNMNCGYIYKHLTDAIKKGLIPESIPDSLLAPVLRTRFKLGLLDPLQSVPFNEIGAEKVNCTEHQSLAYEAAVKSMVLLQNKNNLLPLDRKTISNLLVTGPVSADIQAMVGNYNGWSGNIITFVEGIMEAVDVGTTVDQTPGCLMTIPGNYTGFWQAENADVVIVCLGNSKLTEGEDGDAMLNTDGGDRTDLRLPESQREYIRLLRERLPNKPIIAIITGGSAIALQDVLDAADAVLLSWYPGEQGGKALADIIFGTVSPSGRLPITMYGSVADLPPFDDYSMKGRTYKYFTGKPLFPFGYGLSYTSFEYTQMALEGDGIINGKQLRFSLTVKNTGNRSGEEVVLVYASKGQGMTGNGDLIVPTLEKSLVTFKRISLNAGEEKTLSLEINLRDMHQWNPASREYYIEPGTYIIQTQPSSGSGGFNVQVDVQE